MTNTTVQAKPPRIWRIFNKSMNPFMKWMLRSPLHRFVSHQYMLLSFKGRKTGREYTTPVQYGEEGGTLYVITSAGYTWWKNLRGGAPVDLVVRGESLHGTAVPSDDVQTVVRVFNIIYPRFTIANENQFADGKIAITIQVMR